MLTLDIPAHEFYDESKNEFFYTKPISLRLEHSLVSIAKWESRWKKPFLTKEKHGVEEVRDYIRCMTLNQNVDPTVYQTLSAADLERVSEYISTGLTATTIRDETAKRSREVVTSELIYYWMVAYNIPWEAQKWHLSRLLTLIRICSIKNAPPKKMSKNEVLRRNARLNAQRRAKHHTRG